MRFIIYLIGLLVWTGFCWWLYVCQVKGLCGAIPRSGPDMEEREISGTDGPLLFRWSSFLPEETGGTRAYLDSLDAISLTGDTLLITGLYDMAEVNTGQFDNLGLARANQVAGMVSAGTDQSRIILASRVRDLTAEEEDRAFVAIEIDVKPALKPGAMAPDSVQIYFPYNSTKQFFSKAVEQEIEMLASRVAQTGEIIALTGHTDSFGSSETNYVLGLWRANAIRNLLVEKGVDPNHIRTYSAGELRPKYPNNTKEGRRKNRRVDVRLLTKE